MTLDAYIAKHKKTHVIYDCDETILQLQLPWDTWTHAIRNFLQALDTEILRKYERGELSLSTLQNEYVRFFGQEVKEQLIEYNSAFETQRLTGVTYNHNLLSYIRSSGLTQYLWTSNTASCVLPLLRELNVDTSFARIITLDDVLFLKPEPDGFDHIVDEDIPLEKYLFVGDSTHDEKAAREVGIDFYKIDFFKD